jgi:hypothetical protein
LRPHNGRFASTEAEREEDVFIEAFVRVRGRYSNEEWPLLSPHEIAEAVHREIGIIDAERQSDTSRDSQRPQSWPAVVELAHGPDRRV